jgi:hypothetical protein
MASCALERCSDPNCQVCTVPERFKEQIAAAAAPPKPKKPRKSK